MAVEVFPKRKVTRPHTEISVDTSGIGGASSDSDKILMLIGSAKGGAPNTVYKIRNYQEAKRTFREGELLDAIELAWNPGDLGGAGDILAMRVEDAEQGKLEKDALTFESKIYGNDANDIQIALEDNDLTNTKRLTVTFSKDNYRQVFDNLGKIFSIQYIGEKAQASFTLTKNAGTNKTEALILKNGDSAGTLEPVMEFKLGEGMYEDVNTLITAINNLPDWEAKYFPIGDKNIPTAALDAADNVDVKAEAVYTTSLGGDIVKQLEYNEYVEVSVNTGKEPKNFPLTNLSGGTDSTIPTSWAKKFDKFANEGGYYLVPLTSKQAIHSEALAFVNARSDAGEPMRVIVGGGSDEAMEENITRANTLRDTRASLIGFSGTRRMDDGRILNLPAYMLAAEVAGLACGLEVGEAVTFKHLNVTSVDRILESGELDALNESGVLCLEFVRNRSVTNFRIVQDVTTYNDKTDPVKNEMSVGESNDFLVSELKVKLDDAYIGTKVVNISASLIKNFIQSYLDQKKRNNEIQDYSPEEVQVVIDGDTAVISMTIMPVRSLNKITVSLVYKQQTLTA